MAATRIDAIVVGDPGPLNMRLLDQYRIPNGELVGVVSTTVNEAKVRFLVDNAPHERLAAGVKFRLYEGPHEVARVEVLW
jgi:hypothetical protein